MNKYRYAQLLMMLGQNDVLINHYEECGLTEVAKELKKSSEKYRKEIDANMADIVWYDEEELEAIIKSCNGEWWKLGESHAMTDKYNRTVKENRGK